MMHFTFVLFKHCNSNKIEQREQTHYHLNPALTVELIIINLTRTKEL